MYRRNSKKKFLDKLFSLGEKWVTHHKYKKQTHQLRKAFLDYGSETPDNLETSQYIYYGKCKQKFGSSPVQGLMLESHGELISHILHQAFGESEVPQKVLEVYPKLTKEEWNQILRIANMVLMAFEYDSSDR